MRKIVILLGFFVGFITSCTDFTEQLEKRKDIDGDLTTKASVTEVSTNEWIGLYPDNAILSELTLFGTHDAGTFRLDCGPKSSVAQCQDLNFKEQLEWGVRVFDCRLSENMNFFHSDVYCYADWKEFASTCISFLQANPREFVVAMIKAENAEGPGAVYNSNFQKCIDELGRSHFLFDKNLLNEPISTLRGKIVIVTRGYNKGELGYIEGAPQINWPDDAGLQNPTSETNGAIRVAISDRYTAYPETKVGLVKEVFPEILPTLKDDPSRWFIIFTSGYDYSGNLWIPNPRVYTSKFRDQGLSVMKDRASYLQRGGTLMMDFVNYWTDLRDFVFRTIVHEYYKDIVYVNDIAFRFQDGVATVMWLRDLSVKNLVLPEEIPGKGKITLINIGDKAFENAQLESLTSSVPIGTVGVSAFKNCTSFKNVEGIRFENEFKERAFENCSSLTKIVLKENFYKIGSQAFVGCTKLNLYCYANQPPLTGGVLFDMNSMPFLYVPSVALYTYQNDNIWSKLFNPADYRIRKIQ